MPKQIKHFFSPSFYSLFGRAETSEAVYPFAGRRKNLLGGFLLSFFIFITSLAFALSAYGATFNAASCSKADVQTAINAANAGADADNTVILPACDIVWNYLTEWVTITGNSSKVLRLLGSGTGVTRIKNYSMTVGAHKTNMVEWGRMSIWSDPAEVATTGQTRVVRDSFQPWALGTELYWHDLEIRNYTYNGKLNLAGWYGLMTRMTLIDPPHEPGSGSQDPYGLYLNGWTPYDGQSRLKRGTRNALFFDHDVFYGQTHALSGFCNAYYVLRNSKIYVRGGGSADLHGPGYQGCIATNGTSNMDAGGGFEVYNNEFHQRQNGKMAYGLGNAFISLRSGSSVLVFGNTVYEDGWTPTAGVVSDYPGDGATMAAQSRNCGVGPGLTCNRKYVFENPVVTDGCFQETEDMYVWNNTFSSPTVNFYRIGDHKPPTNFSDCDIWGVNMFESAPAGYTPYGDHPLDAAVTTKWNVTANVSGGHGLLLCSPQVADGNKSACMAVPESGYQVASVSSAPCSNDWTSGDFFYANPAADCAVTATFSLPPGDTTPPAAPIGLAVN